jgi:hypothetical protein
MKKIALLLMLTVAVVGCAKSKAPASHVSHQTQGGKLG